MSSHLSLLRALHSRVQSSCAFSSLPCLCTFYRSISTWNDVLHKQYSPSMKHRLMTAVCVYCWWTIADSSKLYQWTAIALSIWPDNTKNSLKQNERILKQHGRNLYRNVEVRTKYRLDHKKRDVTDLYVYTQITTMGNHHLRVRNVPEGVKVS